MNDDADAPVNLEDEERIAKENFTLADLFGGPPRPGVLPEKKRITFRDLEAVKTYDERRADAGQLRGMYEAAEKPKRNASAEVKKAYAEMAAEVEKADALVEEAREKMLSTALSWHLRAYPEVALKIAKREARKLFLEKDGTLREGYTDQDTQEWLEHRLFGEIVQKVVTADGRIVDFGCPKAELGEMLSNSSNMHPATWQALKDDYQELTLRAGIRLQSVQDPGF
ncbi:MAG: hypothetical protein K0S70_116 [Microbacterium sp.]|jgi:hypothetical protein|nr:hypothetical protein [Microbacterium sp.]